MHKAVVMRSSGSHRPSRCGVRCVLRFVIFHFLGHEQAPASQAQEEPQAQSQALTGAVVCTRGQSL